jgi:multicomponent Na+:H+ antiporter subunit E
VTRYLLATVGLTLVYALALASANPWDLGIGAVLSFCVLLAFRKFLFVLPPVAPSALMRRIAHLPPLALATAATIVRGTVFVARAVLSPRLPQKAGFVAMPDGERSPSGVVISGLLDTLSPGSVLIDIDPAARTWTLHSLDASDPEAIDAELRSFYERYQRPVWP